MLLAESYKIQTENHSNSNNIETTTMTDGKDEMQPTQITTAAVSQFDAIDNEVVSTLIDLDGGFQCLLDKVKNDMQTAKDVALFLKKRAAIEEEYGKQMVKLAQSMSESNDKSSSKAGSFGSVWSSFLKVHETLGEQRVKFSTDIVEVADDVQIMCKDTEKSRKQVKEIGLRHDRNRQESESALDKSKQKYEASSEDWEKAILARNSNDDHLPKKGLFKNNKTPAQLKKQVDESCSKAEYAHSSYKNQLVSTNAARHDYFQNQLPSDIITLKSIGDECCTAMRYQLARYAYVFEEGLTKDGLALDNDQGTGLRSLTEKIDYTSDTAEYVKDYGKRSKRLNKDDIPYKEYSMSPTALTILKPNPVFGVDLLKLMKRDGKDVPLFVEKCVEAIEAQGLKTVGIYRLSGTSTQIQRLKNQFDRDCKSVNLFNDESISDINNITSVLKLWFRELPDPLFPRSAYQHFMNAARIENDRMRVLGLHTIINDLPDANYAILKFIMRHLDHIQQNQEHNKMNTANLATIFGMTFLGGDQTSTISSQQDAQRLTDTHLHVKVVQTVLENYRLIFEPDE